MHEELDVRRRHVLDKMMAIRSMRRGTLNEQFVERVHEGKSTGQLRGPYYVLSRHEGGKTVSSRVRSGHVRAVRADLARFKEFTALCEEFAQLTQRLGELERQQAASQEALKKRPASPSSSRPK